MIWIAISFYCLLWSRKLCCKEMAYSTSMWMRLMIVFTMTHKNMSVGTTTKLQFMRVLVWPVSINQSINTRICIVQNKQSKMPSNALSVSALEQASFQLFAESVAVHSSVGRAFHVAGPPHTERATTSTDRHTTVNPWHWKIEGETSCPGFWEQVHQKDIENSVE